jgi:hypothetical protein
MFIPDPKGCLSNNSYKKAGGKFLVFFPIWRHKYHKIKLFLVLKIDDENFEPEH